MDLNTQSFKLLWAGLHEANMMEMNDMSNIQDLYFGGDMNAAPALSGQSVGLIDEVKSVKDIINQTVSEFNEACTNFSKYKLEV